ncbi:MAG: hypothetical protein KF857_04630 [Fimbriimonadaceae bacterium]|nr:hypothetical protein [Fimbriimonadaceae bacterium]
MSPFSNRSVRFAAGAAVMAGAAWACWWGTVRLFSVDPFADFRPANTPEQGIELGAFQLRSFIGGRLVAYASVKEATARRDRSILDLVGLTDGKLTSDSGDVYNFSATTATYGTFNKSLTAESGARIWNEHLDLGVPRFSYDGTSRVLRVDGAVSGRLEDGAMVAAGVTLDLAKQELLVNTFDWQGQAAASGQGRQEWKIKGEKSHLTNDLWTSQNARAESSDTIAYGKSLSLDRKNDVLTITGDVRYYGTDANMTCDKVTIYRKEGRSVLEGNVHMLVKPETDNKPVEVQIPPLAPVVPESISQSRPPAPATDAGKSQEDAVRDRENLRQYPAAVVADRIEYWYKKGSRRAVITGNPQARQELPGNHWRMVWANEAFYDGEKDRLKLVSREGKKDARIKNSLGDDLQCVDVLVSTKKGDDMMEASEPEGVVTVRDDETPEKPGGGSGGGTTGGAPPSVTGPIGGGRRG